MLQQTLQAQQAAAMSEVASRDARIQQLSQENQHAQQSLQTTLTQTQMAVSTQKHEAEQVCCSYHGLLLASCCLEHAL